MPRGCVSHSISNMFLHIQAVLTSFGSCLRSIESPPSLWGSLPTVLYHGFRKHYLITHDIYFMVHGLVYQTITFLDTTDFRGLRFSTMFSCIRGNIHMNSCAVQFQSLLLTLFTKGAPYPNFRGFQSTRFIHENYLNCTR